MATKMKAVRIHRRGGPEVLSLDTVEVPEPGPGQVRIRVAAAGVNYADVGQRQGSYPNLAPLPVILGFEVAGVVDAAGPGVELLRPDARVTSHVEGGYAEYAIANAMEVMPLPDNVSFEAAIALPIQGLTAYLALDTGARIRPGDTVLVHSAAGGVGSMAIQIARQLGSPRVIGTTRSEEKMKLIRELGAEPLSIRDPGWVEKVMEITGGRGVDIVLDAVGGQIGQQSLETMAPFGRMVVYGGLSGQPTMIAAQQLVRKCLSVTGFNTPSQRPEEMAKAGRALVTFLVAGELRPVIGASFPLEQAARGHAVLEGGSSTGKVILTV